MCCGARLQARVRYSQSNTTLAEKRIDRAAVREYQKTCSLLGHYHTSAKQLEQLDRVLRKQMDSHVSRKQPASPDALCLVNEQFLHDSEETIQQDR
mmetsp:Transcript_6396/g.10952  ORF Transcript_6396/g.10952 Transcript_6396/m.10952 type:complete len:96 (+) Transcript_6396:164-451(+)